MNPRTWHYQGNNKAFAIGYDGQRGHIWAEKKRPSAHSAKLCYTFYLPYKSTQTRNPDKRYSSLQGRINTWNAIILLSMLERSYVTAREVSSEGNAKFKRTPHAFMLQTNVCTSEDPNSRRKGGCWTTPGGSLTGECCIWNQATIMHRIHIFISKILLAYEWFVGFFSCY